MKTYITIGLISWFTLSTIQAQLPSPTPDGGYPNHNTVEGEDALLNVTTGSDNTAIGYIALRNNTDGNSNTAVGSESLFRNTHGAGNTATGAGSLGENTKGTGNTATGWDALGLNKTGGYNTAVGSLALLSNIGSGGSGFVLNGSNSVAVGWSALYSNTTGHDNTAIGFSALFKNTTGFLNTALGSVAGSRTTGDNNIDIGNEGAASESNTIRIGTEVPVTDIYGFILPAHTAAYIAGISGTAIGGGTAVRINANGQLGTAPSSARFKEEIKPMGEASETILALKPVTFRYKPQVDPERSPQYGLVAEEVEKVNRDLVARDREGKPYTVRYEAVNAMLLNEFLKEHRIVEQLKKDFESKIAEQQKQIEALTAGLQKVSAQLEASKPVPQMVNNP
jgi:hypothetical protein